MEKYIIIALILVTYSTEVFNFIYEKSGLLEIEKLESEITFNNF